MSRNQIPSVDDVGRQLLPVAVDSIDESSLKMDLFLRHASGPPTLYRASGVEFTSEDHARLGEKGIRFVYVPKEQYNAYRRAVVDRVEKLFGNADVARDERARLIRASCSQLIEDALMDPGMLGPESPLRTLGQKFGEWAVHDSEEFAALLDMSEHDYYTASHMLNVGVGCGLLAAELSGDGEWIGQVIQGGLLHDVGKRNVPEEILNKEGRLSEAEWRMIQAHPAKGHELLCVAREGSPIILEMTRDHHERLDGGGYPGGLRSEQIGRAARLCAVVDVYDALSTARPYRQAVPPLQTLSMMAEEVGRAFDEELLSIWRGLIERQTPEERRTPIAKIGSMEHVMAQPPDQSQTAPGGRDRRMAERFDCDLPAHGVFVRQGKDLPIGLGERFSLKVRDLSRTGLAIATPWPMTRGDRLDLEMTGAGGRIIKRRVEVVSVRSLQDSEWRIGVRFVGDDQAYAA